MILEDAVAVATQELDAIRIDGRKTCIVLRSW